MTEQQIQTKKIKELEESGYYVIKLIKTNKNGIPDILALHPTYGIEFYEIKKPKGIYPILFSFFFYGGLFTLIQAFLLKDYLGPAPSLDSWIQMIPWLILIAILFHIPTNVVILGAPSRIGASLFSIIILFEIVVGSISAALLTEELFGWREGVGCAMIILAGLSEIVFASQPKQRTSS